MCLKNHAVYKDIYCVQNKSYKSTNYNMVWEKKSLDFNDKKEN